MFGLVLKMRCDNGRPYGDVRFAIEMCREMPGIYMPYLCPKCFSWHIEPWKAEAANDRTGKIRATPVVPEPVLPKMAFLSVVPKG